jgi:hypothetical protein
MKDTVFIVVYPLFLFLVYLPADQTTLLWE